MIEQEFLFLGLLKEKPMHGYEIKKRIRDILSLFASIDPKSIYYPLTVLEKKGLVAKHTGKQGRRPVRFTYALTAKGDSRFQNLLAQSFLDFKRPQFSLDLSLYFLNYIEPQLARRRLRARLLLLGKLLKNLRQARKSVEQKKLLSLARILEHDLEMVETEHKFISRLLVNPR